MKDTYYIAFPTPFGTAVMSFIYSDQCKWIGADGTEGEFSDLKIEGNVISFTASAGPAPVEWYITVEGDKATGIAKMGEDKHEVPIQVGKGSRDTLVIEKEFDPSSAPGGGPGGSGGGPGGPGGGPGGPGGGPGGPGGGPGGPGGGPGGPGGGPSQK